MRTATRIPGLALTALVLLIGSCGDDPGVHALGGDDTGAVVSAEVGDTVEIALDSNPSTGYSWTVPDDLGGVEFVEETWTSDSELVGSPGTTTLVFEVVEGGTWTIDLEYRRPWLPAEPPELTFEVTIRAG